MYKIITLCDEKYQKEYSMHNFLTLKYRHLIHTTDPNLELIYFLSQMNFSGTMNNV